MEYVIAGYSIIILLLAWGVYRLNYQLVSLSERLQRQGKRINEVLYKASRVEKLLQDNEKIGQLFDDKRGTYKKAKCPTCGREYSSAYSECPYCNVSKKNADNSGGFDWEHTD